MSNFILPCCAKHKTTHEVLQYNAKRYAVKLPQCVLEGMTSVENSTISSFKRREELLTLHYLILKIE